MYKGSLFFDVVQATSSISQSLTQCSFVQIVYLITLEGMSRYWKALILMINQNIVLRYGIQATHTGEASTAL